MADDTRLDPRRLKRPSLRGAIMIDTPNGKLRMRAWPKKRGTPKSAKVREQNEWFKKTTQLIKYAAANQQREAIEAPKGTGLLPRDLLMRAVSEGFYDIYEPSGQVIGQRRKGYNRVMYQGLIAKVTNGFSLPANSLVTLSMQLPQIDTAGMYNIASPTLITIPQGIQVVDINVAIYCNVATAADLTVFIQKIGVSGIWGGNVQEPLFTDPYCQARTGPIVVTGGDQFRVRARCNSAHTVIGNVSHIQCEIKEAV